MEDLIRTEIDILVLLSRNLIGVGVVDIVKVSRLIPVYFHNFREQRIHSQYRVLPIPDDLCISVAP